MGSTDPQARRRVLALAALLCCMCDDGPADRRHEAGPAAIGDRASGVRPGGARQDGELASLPRPGPRDHLLEAHLSQWVTGDLDRACRLYMAVAADRSAAAPLRARALLRLAELAEATGDRRAALSHLDRARVVAGPGTRLAQVVDDRRARILVAAPLADVRGPVPGSFHLKHEPPQLAAVFRRAETRLAAFHRVVVAPRLENINSILQAKKRSLAAAEAAYGQVLAQGGPEARAASLFRIGAMYHHLAEAQAFEPPPELLPFAARQLRLELRAESRAYLRRSLERYRQVLQVPAGPGTDRWQTLARQEASTLQVVLGAAKSSTPAR